MTAASLELPPVETLATLARAADDGVTSLEAFDRLRRATSKSHLGVAGLAAVLDGEAALAARLFDGGVLAEVVRRAAALREQLPDSVALLARGRSAQVELDRAAVLSLLSAVLVGAVERVGRGTYPRVLFSHLLAADAPQEQAKLRCVLEYFVRSIAAPPRGRLTIERRALAPIPDASWWAGRDAPLGALVVHERGVIEEALGCTQADFANCYIGGGVLRGGCVQEEIRFSVSTELLVSLLLCEVMADHEAIVLRGSEQLSRTRGYAFSLRWDGALDDPCARAADGTPLTEVVAIDAIPFSRRTSAAEQLGEAIMLRETNKAYVGFAPTAGDDALPPPVASGNWGCGVFGGDLQVKAIVQWLAASAAGRELRYYTFSDQRLGDLPSFVHTLRERGATVGALWRAAIAAGTRGAGDGDVYRAVLDALR